VSHARELILQRRSAVAFDGTTRLDRATFLSILARAMPADGAPWDVMWWTPRVHLVLFVHRVDDVEPGLYVLIRRETERDASEALDSFRQACGREFLWERVDDAIPLYCLGRGDCAALARRLSCDQDIAADGCFSLGMVAEFERSLAEHGPAFYRQLFWETGVVGQVLYLEAERAGIRATGIGCFYDDPVHDVLGLNGHAFQSLYHFTIGGPVEDRRLTTEPGYRWG
jgi:nitroreductase